MSFVQRDVQLAIKLADGSGTNQPSNFAGTTSNTVTIKGLRTSVKIQNSGTPSGSIAQVSVYGLSPSLMNELATLGVVFQLIPRNVITITAGDLGSIPATVFSGTIMQAYGDYNMSPDVPFNFECNSGLLQAVAPTPALSYTGATSVATIIETLAGKMGLTFENNGVDVQLSSPYLSGSLLTQLRTCAEHAGINAEIIDGAVLAIWPRGKSRTGGATPLISPSTGMIGYPSYTQFGIILKTVFNPDIKFGGLVQVQSDLKQASGSWAIYKLDHHLESQVPHGQWMSTLYAYNPNFEHPNPPGA